MNKIYKTLLLAVITFGLFGCSHSATGDNGTKLEAKMLLVDHSVYSQYWIEGETRSYPPDIDVEHVYISFIHKRNSNIVSGHQISRYMTTEDSASDYEVLAARKPGDTDDQDLASLVNVTLTADDSSTTCGIVTVTHLPLCATVARYDDYISVFSSYIKKGAMSISDYNQILQKIDDRISRAIITK